MKSRKIVSALTAVAAGVTALAVAGSAFAASQAMLTARSIHSADGRLSLTASSVGDSAATHGNASYWTSPIDASGSFYWFNQPVTLGDFAFTNNGFGVPVFGAVTYRLNLGSGYSAPVALPAPFTVAYEGVYSLDVSGTDAGGAVESQITPAFGIDHSDPVVTTDSKPVIGSLTTVTVSATDTVSGISNVVFWVDGLENYSMAPSMASPADFSAPFTFTGAGPHSITWAAFDNAGNMSTGTRSFRLDATAPTTVSNAVALYNGAATIRLTAKDDLGGAGLGHTYYSIDGTAAAEGTTVKVAAPVDGYANHTITFWSVDAVGNVESAHTASFRVNSRHSITPSKNNTHGAITPSTKQWVNLGANSPTFKITPYANYKVSAIYIDGKKIATTYSYRFNKVTKNHTIKVYFVHK